MRKEKPLSKRYEERGRKIPKYQPRGIMYPDRKKINIDKDTCKKIALAIVERWCGRMDDEEEVMKIVFRNRKSIDAVDEITEDLFNFLDRGYAKKQEDAFFELFELVRPVIAEILKEFYDSFVEDYKDDPDSPYAAWREEDAERDRRSCLT